MRYLEDFQVGDKLQTHSATIAEDAAIAFAAQYDPQPMHLDPAVSGPLGGLSASGWQTACVVMRLMIDADPLRGGPMIGMGVDEIRWPFPVRPGDTLAAELEVVSITPSRSKPTHGVVRMRVTAKNQHGQVVLSMYPNLWIPCRP